MTPRASDHAVVDHSHADVPLPDPFPVVVLGLDDRRLSTLELVFAGPGAHGWVLATDDDARGAIVDLDGPDGDRRIADQRQRHPHRPLILLALKPVPPQLLGSDHQVLKPVQVKELISALGDLRERASAGWSPSAAAPGPERPAPEPAPVPEPEVVSEPEPVSTVQPEATPVPEPPVVELEPAVVELEPAVVELEPAQPVLARTSSRRAARQEQPANPATKPIPAPTRRQPTRPRLQLVPAVGDPGAPKPKPEPEPEPEVARGGAADLPPSHYDPNCYLQGLVVQACRAALARDQAVHVDGLWPTITLLPSTGTAIIAGGEAALEPHAALPDLLSSARLTFTPAPRFSPNHPDAVPLDALIWQLALAASRGRLPAGTPVDRLCVLRGWPNFTRLAPAPGAMGIAALWTQAPHTLLDTAETLRLPHSHVFSFYSAADALGLVADEQDPPPPPPRPTPAPIARPGFLRRAFARLRVG